MSYGHNYINTNIGIENSLKVYINSLGHKSR